MLNMYKKTVRKKKVNRVVVNLQFSKVSIPQHSIKITSSLSQKTVTFQHCNTIFTFTLSLSECLTLQYTVCEIIHNSSVTLYAWI